MANELRVYQDLLGGRISDNPLTSGATTLNSAALAAMVAIGSSAHMMLVLDPDGMAGAPEIVMVTAHTAAATSCTIARGLLGSAARAHAQGTDFVASPVLASDLQRGRWRETVVDDAAGDFTTSSSTFGPVEATKFAYHTWDLAVGDGVELEFNCSFATTGGNMAGFDFEVDRPTSANTRTRPNSDYGAQAGRDASSASTYLPICVKSRFIATEAGVHGFRPIFMVQGGTLNVSNAATINDVASSFISTFVGPEG